MRKNRLLAVVCAVVMNMSTLIGSIPVFAEETAEPNVQTDMKITGTSPLGEMLADKLTPEQTTLNEQNGCSIYDVKLSDKQAYVQFDTALDCTLLLTLFDDAEEKLLTSVDAEVTSEQTEIILDVPDMPEYCYLHCCLVDTETLAPVSAEYTSALYTKEMQEFLSKMTDDYDEDLVLNLDEDKSKNFLILNEDIVFLHADETTNTVIFDQANRTVTLSNYDENAAKLKAGDTVFLDQGDDGAVFCVDAVAIEADAIVITASEAKLEDLFAYINIDMDATNILENPEEPSAESPSHAKPPQYLPSGSFSIEQEKMSFGPYSFGNEDSDVSGAATIMLQPTLQCYYSGLHAYAEYDLNIDVLLNKLMLIIKAKKEIPIVTLNLSFGLDYGKDGFSGSNPVDGEIGQKGGLAKIKEYMSGIMPSTESISLLKIQFGVNLVLDGNCTVQGSCTVSNSAGLCLDTTNGCKPRTTMPKLTQTNLSADGEIFIGASVDYSVTILELPVPKFLGFGFDIKPIFVVGQKNPMGFQLTVHPSQQYLGGKWQPGDANHLCNCCYEGEVFAKSSTQSSVTSEIIPDFLLPEPKEAVHQNTKILDWHYSKDYNEFALTPCPRHYYKVEIMIKDKDNKPISGATVTCSSENAARSNERSAVSDKNGIAVLYLNSGVRYLHLEKEGYPAGDGVVRVLGADCDVELMMDGSGKTRRLKNTSRDTVKSYWGEPDETGCVWADNVRYQLYDDHAEVSGAISPAYLGQLLDLSVYAVINGLPVTAVSGSAFIEDRRLHTIKLPETVTSIERFAFCNCTNLTSISIPNSVRRINEHVFAGCTSLKSIHIPKSLEYIDTFAFAGSGLTSVTIPGKVQTIYENTFSDCNDLNTVIISEGVEHIYRYAFLQCAKLSSVTLPDSLKSIGEYAFDGCTSLTSIYFPAGLEYVDISAFSGWTELSSYEVDPANWHYKALDGVLFNGDMTQLVQYPGRNPRTSYTIPDSVTCIGDQAFTDATNLISVTLPDHLKSIGGDAFGNCTALTEITLPNSVSSIEAGAFYNCESLTSITLPDGITEIQPNTFAECTSLSSVFIPDSVTTIDTQAFTGCSFTSIHIPDSVNSFGFGVFTGCTNLTSFALPASLKEFGFSMFQLCENLKSVYIPIGVKRIDEEQYFDSTGITDIYYAGSEADWNAIEFYNGWGLIEDYSCPAAIHYNSTASAAAPPVMPKPRFAADETEPTTTTTTELKSTTTSFSTTEAASTTTTTTETEPVETTAITSRDETDLTILTPNSVYNIYAVKSREYGVSAGNLLYFAQAVSDENGVVSVNYDGAMFAVKAKYNLENAEFSVPELAYDGSEKEIFPTVTANGKTLIEGMDYLVSGSYTGTEPGGYSILLEGTGDWFGEKALTYVIEKEMTTDVTTTTTNLTTTTTTSNQTATTTTSTTPKLTTTVTNSTTPKPTTATTTSTTSKPTTTTTTSTASKPTTTTTTSTTPKQTTTSTTAKPTTTITTTTETTVTTSETKSTEQTYLLGDVNADNEISVEDAQLALTAYVKVMAGMDSGLTDQQLKAADINGDGEVSVEDAQLTLLYYVSNTLSHQTVTWDELLGKDKPPVTTTATTASTSKPTSTFTTATTSKK